MVSKAHRGMMHVPRRGGRRRGPGYRQPDRTPRDPRIKRPTGPPRLYRPGFPVPTPAPAVPMPPPKMVSPTRPPLTKKGPDRQIRKRRPRTHGDPMPTRRFPKEEQQVAQAVRNPKEIMQLPTVNKQTTRSQLEKMLRENMTKVANFNAAQARNRQITPRQRQASLENSRRRRGRNFRNRGPR